MAVIDRFLQLKSGYLGKFRSAVDDPGFVSSGPAKGHLIVFPREEVAITQEKQRPFVANATNVVLYNRGTDYRRHPIAARGDHCDFLDIEDEALGHSMRNVLGKTGICWDADRPFPVANHIVPSRLFQTQRRLFELAHNAGSPQEINSLLQSVIDQVVACACCSDTATGYQTGCDSHWRLVFRAQQFISKNYEHPLTTESISRSLNVSQFHLCRVFRQQTGVNIHRYVQDLRLRKATAMFRDNRRDLTAIAERLGFSSHSHFTSCFRRAFKITPQEWRSKSLAFTTRRVGDIDR